MKKGEESFTDKVIALCQEKRLTYREACAVLGARGGRKAANRRKKKALGLALMERRGLW